MSMPGHLHRGLGLQFGVLCKFSRLTDGFGTAPWNPLPTSMQGSLPGASASPRQFDTFVASLSGADRHNRNAWERIFFATFFTLPEMKCIRARRALLGSSGLDAPSIDREQIVEGIPVGLVRLIEGEMTPAAKLVWKQWLEIRDEPSGGGKSPATATVAIPIPAPPPPPASAASAASAASGLDAQTAEHPSPAQSLLTHLGEEHGFRTLMGAEIDPEPEGARLISHQEHSVPMPETLSNAEPEAACAMSLDREQLDASYQRMDEGAEPGDALQQADEWIDAVILRLQAIQESLSQPSSDEYELAHQIPKLFRVMMNLLESSRVARQLYTTLVDSLGQARPGLERAEKVAKQRLEWLLWLGRAMMDVDFSLSFQEATNFQSTQYVLHAMSLAARLAKLVVCRVRQADEADADDDEADADDDDDDDEHHHELEQEEKEEKAARGVVVSHTLLACTVDMAQTVHHALKLGSTVPDPSCWHERFREKMKAELSKSFQDDARKWIGSYMMERRCWTNEEQSSGLYREVARERAFPAARLLGIGSALERDTKLAECEAACERIGFAESYAPHLVLFKETLRVQAVMRRQSKPIPCNFLVVMLAANLLFFVALCTVLIPEVSASALSVTMGTNLSNQRAVLGLYNALSEMNPEQVAEWTVSMKPAPYRHWRRPQARCPGNATATSSCHQRLLDAITSYATGINISKDALSSEPPSRSEFLTVVAIIGIIWVGAMVLSTLISAFAKCFCQKHEAARGRPVKVWPGLCRLSWQLPWQMATAGTPITENHESILRHADYTVSTVIVAVASIAMAQFDDTTGIASGMAILVACCVGSLAVLDFFCVVYPPRPGTWRFALSPVGGWQLHNRIHTLSSHDRKHMPPVFNGIPVTRFIRGIGLAIVSGVLFLWGYHLAVKWGVDSLGIPASPALLLIPPRSATPFPSGFSGVIQMTSVIVIVATASVLVVLFGGIVITICGPHRAESAPGTLASGYVIVSISTALLLPCSSLIYYDETIPGSTALFSQSIQLLAILSAVLLLGLPRIVVFLFAFCGVLDSATSTWPAYQAFATKWPDHKVGTFTLEVANQVLANIARDTSSSLV